MKIKYNFMLFSMLMVMAVFFAYWAWKHLWQQDHFECGARMYIKLLDNMCNKVSSVDVFLSLHGDGLGYLLVSGTHACRNTEVKAINGTVDFTYQKKGRYYSLHFGQRDPAVIALFDMLKEGNIKIKITETNNGDYIISSPMKTTMLCTVE